jgi:hypothetical protein
MRKKRVLKKSKSGSELEFFILNSKGNMVNEAEKFRKIANKKFPELDVRPEAGLSMIEIGSYPSVNVMDTFLDILEKIKKLIEVAEENDYVLFPLGTYPGTAKPEITKTRRYKEQAVILGRKEAINASLCCGFHYHYTLPKGVFDFEKKFLKSMVNSKIKQSLIDSYNLSIAMDPAITTFLQSSPFIQGKHIAKDSRIVVYRGGKKLGYSKGKYARFQLLGGLPPYKQTLNDLMFSLRKRQEKWGELMEKKGLKPSWIIKEDNILDFTWNPVKINSLGTLEIRSPDMNHPEYVIAMGSLLKFVFRQIYRDFYKVFPSDIGLKEPFKVEGKIIHIPPHTHVRNFLQRESAYQGFASREVTDYCRRFFNFAKSFLDVNYVPVVEPLQELLDRRESVSDKIIGRFKRAGYGVEDKIPNEVAADVALKSCRDMLKEVDMTEARLYRAYA